MQLITKFHKMELETELFELGKEENLPVWDILRYHVYIDYYYPEKERQNVSIVKKHSIIVFWKNLIF